MTLIKRRNIVAHVRRNQNLFVLDLIKSEKAIIVGQKRPTYNVNKNK